MFHIPGFNTIRFFAALAVIITHIENFKRKSGDGNIYYLTRDLGRHGVTIFFVLSGFLITYLLLQELKSEGAISIRKFYIRRVLRVWPLYFLILLLGFYIFPAFWYPDYFINPIEQPNGYLKNLLLHIAILPNLALYLFGPSFCLSVLWSIGIEEQFYLVWPRVINLKPSLKQIMVITLVYLTISFIFLSLGSIYSEVSFFRITYMMMAHDGIIFGSLFAFLLFNRRRYQINVIFSPYAVGISIITPLVMLYCQYTDLLNDSSAFVLDKAVKVCYCILLVNIGFNRFLKNIFTNSLFNWLGKISYGLYMYHPIAIAACIYIYDNLLQINSIFDHLIFYLITITLTITISGFSYEFFEKPLLKLKSKFSVVKSRH